MICLSTHWKTTCNKIMKTIPQYILLYVFFFWKWSCSVVSDSLRPHGLYPTRFHRQWDFPGTNTGVGCHFLLQEIFPTQGLNPGLPHCRQMLLPSEPPGKSPGIFFLKCSLNNLWHTNIVTQTHTPILVLIYAFLATSNPRGLWGSQIL